MPTEEITLDPGQSGQVSFEVVPTEVKTYLVSVNGLTGTFETVGAPGQLQIERFYILDIPMANDGEFEVHCHIRNVGQGPATGILNLKGQIFIAGGQLIREIDESETIIVGPGETYDYKWDWYSRREDSAWVQLSGDWGEQTRRVDFIIGYSQNELVEVSCLKPDHESVILRYTQRSVCNRWTVRATHPPPPEPREHMVSYPLLASQDKWLTLYHVVTGLWSGSRYRGYVYGYTAGGAHRSGECIFTTT